MTNYQPRSISLVTRTMLGSLCVPPNVLVIRIRVSRSPETWPTNEVEIFGYRCLKAAKSFPVVEENNCVPAYFQLVDLPRFRFLVNGVEGGSWLAGDRMGTPATGSKKPINMLNTNPTMYSRNQTSVHGTPHDDPTEENELSLSSWEIHCTRIVGKRDKIYLTHLVLFRWK